MHKIGILSDTHGLLREEVRNLLHTCDVILHGGDFHTEDILAELKTIAPVYAVRGNADKEWAARLPETLSIELFHIRFFLIHNKKQIKEDLSDRNIIVYGHSHKYENLQTDGQIWLNPGSCGKRRFSLPVTMALVTVEENGAFKIERIDLATSSLPADTLPSHKDMKDIVLYVMKETNKGRPVEIIAKNCHISEDLATQICRLYLTHPGVSADGILSKMGL